MGGSSLVAADVSGAFLGISEETFDDWLAGQILIQVGDGGPTLQYSTYMVIGPFSYRLARVVDGGALHMANIQHVTSVIVRDVAPGETVMLSERANVHFKCLVVVRDD